MRVTQFKLLSGGLAAILTILACRTGSPATPTALAVADTALPVPAGSTPTAARLPILASPSIQSLDMLDDHTGWALTDAAVLRTTDSGARWYDVTPTGLNTAAPYRAFFLDAATAWLTVPGTDPTSGTLFHTSDGGLTWTSVAVPFGDGSLMFVDATHGWELVGLSAGMSHEAVAIFRTSDGGATWSKVFTDDPGAPGSSDSLPLVGDKTGITALDNDHAWVTGSQPSEDFIYIYATRDGGATWVHQELNLPAGYGGAMTNAYLPVFFDASEAVLPVQLFANDTGADFYVSHDGGQTWTATTPVAQAGHLAVATASDFFVWDGSSTLNASHDAGATWSTLTPNINIKETMASMQFVNATTGWVLTSDINGHRMLYTTIDGGAAWNVLVP
jgi:photosystem II stability/assembly factor-like uncharacterized protein